MAKIAVGQLCSTASMTSNLAQCRILMEKSLKANAKVLFLPEASDYIAQSALESIELAVPASQSSFVIGLQAEARKNALPIHVGIHEPTEDRRRVKNVQIWIDADGEICHKYQKLHMFDVDLPNGPKLKESDSVEPGHSICLPFASPVGKIGSMICFDLRFPTLSSRLREQGAEILTYPSAFTVATGKAGHWTGLLQARAIENQSYVIAAAQVGRHNEMRVSYGRSLVVDPWGKIVAEAPGVDEWEPRSGPDIIFADIDHHQLEKIRRDMPLQPRQDVVKIVDTTGSCM